MVQHDKKLVSRAVMPPTPQSRSIRLPFTFPSTFISKASNEHMRSPSSNRGTTTYFCVFDIKGGASADGGITGMPGTDRPPASSGEFVCLSVGEPPADDPASSSSSSESAGPNRLFRSPRFPFRDRRLDICLLSVSEPVGTNPGGRLSSGNMITGSVVLLLLLSCGAGGALGMGGEMKLSGSLRLAPNVLMGDNVCTGGP